MRILRGIFHLSCTLPEGDRCPREFVNDCRHDCVDCSHSRIAAISLDGEEIREIKGSAKPEPKVKKAKKR